MLTYFLRSSKLNPSLIILNGLQIRQPLLRSSASLPITTFEVPKANSETHAPTFFLHPPNCTHPIKGLFDVFIMFILSRSRHTKNLGVGSAFCSEVKRPCLAVKQTEKPWRKTMAWGPKTSPERANCFWTSETFRNVSSFDVWLLAPCPPNDWRLQS